MITYGGHSPKYELLDDTWAFDFLTSSWTPVLMEEQGSRGPGPRAGEQTVVVVVPISAS